MAKNLLLVASLHAASIELSEVDVSVLETVGLNLKMGPKMTNDLITSLLPPVIFASFCYIIVNGVKVRRRRGGAPITITFRSSLRSSPPILTLERGWSEATAKASDRLPIALYYLPT